jgi:hypothetical protein
VLLVVLPLAFIPRPVHVDVASGAVGLIVQPIPLKHIPVGVQKAPATICHVIIPVPLIFAPVNPNLNPSPSFQPIFWIYLALINSTIGKVKDFADASLVLDERGSTSVYEGSKAFFQLSNFLALVEM